MKGAAELAVCSVCVVVTHTLQLTHVTDHTLAPVPITLTPRGGNRMHTHTRKCTSKYTRTHTHAHTHTHTQVELSALKLKQSACHQKSALNALGSVRF